MVHLIGKTPIIGKKRQSTCPWCQIEINQGAKENDKKYQKRLYLHLSICPEHPAVKKLSIMTTAIQSLCDAPLHERDQWIEELKASVAQLERDRIAHQSLEGESSGG